MMTAHHRVRDIVHPVLTRNTPAGDVAIRHVARCGKETARMLSAWGATVIIACRDTTRGERAAREMRSKSTKAGGIRVEYLDLASLKSVRAFARRITAAGVPLNILVNNAGVRTDAFTKTDDGIELHYQVAIQCAVTTRNTFCSKRTHSIVYSLWAQVAIWHAESASQHVSK
jgi:NAD(P)-dependent dehydrogenase (short-subunit alcohol dehydrogenase family)